MKSILLFSKKYNDFRLLVVGIIILLTFTFLISKGNLTNIYVSAAADGNDYDLKEVKDDVYVVSARIQCHVFSY